MASDKDHFTGKSSAGQFGKDIVGDQVAFAKNQGIRYITNRPECIGQEPHGGIPGQVVRREKVLGRKFRVVDRGIIQMHFHQPFQQGHQVFCLNTGCNRQCILKT